MSSSNEINVLKQHIRELSNEISTLTKSVNPYMTSKEYIAVHNRFLNLSNLKAIAKNELEVRLHYYKVTLKGAKKSDNEVRVEKVFRKKLVSEIDLKSYFSKNFDSLNEIDHEIYAHLQRSYSNFFADGKFLVKKIVQIR
ncbi:hypothetical protein [Aurantibacillus circumpalustris]|uniref:hypothetical protein n=1 Tax=Aurantibacillus circumpalustris TaxID=3036359 RepID=UPI00295B3A4F|nr:hypothetical protein [Aurantibacillus circumpalustris]